MRRSVVYAAAFDAQFTAKRIFLQAKPGVKIDRPGSHLLHPGRGPGVGMGYFVFPESFQAAQDLLVSPCIN
jgi:hypothetical protein